MVVKMYKQRKVNIMIGGGPRGVSCEGAKAPRLRTVALVAVCTLFLTNALPVLAQVADLSPEQKARARLVEQRLMAPCCFGGTLADHHSEIAEDLKKEVRLMVAKGATVEEVVDYFGERYGERILAAPKVSGFNLLAYAMPVVALVVGLSFVMLFFRRARKVESAAGSEASARTPALDESLKARMSEELDRFNA